MQTELVQPGNLLSSDGKLSQVGWSPHPVLTCNLENAHFYPVKLLQRFRIKRWDYYAIFTPHHFFSATISDLGYAGNIFVYILDFGTGDLHEEGLVIPLGKGIVLPRDSTSGETVFEDQRANLHFQVLPEGRRARVDWPAFHQGRGIQADLKLYQAPDHESMTIVIPIGKGRFYYNRKINCLPAEGTIKYGNMAIDVKPDSCLGSLDWGRGVWEYKSYWNWASASGFLPDGRRIGLNFGCGFGDLSAATENCVILDGRLSKLEQVTFNYDPNNYMHPWRFRDSDDRLQLEFMPFKERIAITNLGIIYSEVHQMFGRYAGTIRLDGGEIIHLADLVGFAEEHHARW